MKSMTQDENCVKDGDYIAWEDMEWILCGKARLNNFSFYDLFDESHTVCILGLVLTYLWAYFGRNSGFRASGGQSSPLLGGSF